MLGSVEAMSVAHAERLARADALRVAGVVLGAELAWLAPADIAGAGPDSLRIRALRGTGIVCAGGATDVLVRYQGLRLPEPEKDSVLVVERAERTIALSTVAAAPGACFAGTDETVQRWSGVGPIPTGAVLLVFETGSYSFGGGALRYRRGRAGRQPLTGELLGARAAFALRDRDGAPAAAPSGAATVEAEFPDSAASYATLGGRRLRVPLLNAQDSALSP